MTPIERLNLQKGKTKPGTIITDQLTEPEYRNSTKIIELDKLQEQQTE